VDADRATEPRPAATVILLRDATGRLEVLLVRRNPAARFMGGVWVFPGGAVDAGETARGAGVREVAEEAGITLPDPDALVEFSRWITPPQFEIRFDALFFVVRCPEGAVVQPDGAETVDARWYAPADALTAGIQLAFPTIRTLEQIAGVDLPRAPDATGVDHPRAPDATGVDHPRARDATGVDHPRAPDATGVDHPRARRSIADDTTVDSVEAVLRWAADHEVRAREPQLVGGRLVIPGE
jgi:8-oxo-dGTP pyrophosphatase MutT (NUDIX family)